MKIDKDRNRIYCSQICGVQTSYSIIMKFCMPKLKTKIFEELFSEIDLSLQKQRYVDSLCCNSLETPCRAIIVFFLLFDSIITDGLTNGSTDKASYKVVTENTLGKSKFNKAGYTAIQSRTAGQEQ